MQQRRVKGRVSLMGSRGLKRTPTAFPWVQHSLVIVLRQHGKRSKGFTRDRMDELCQDITKRSWEVKVPTPMTDHQARSSKEK